MEYRIDGAVTSAGLLASAKTFSLILRPEGLYVIHTGPATGRPAGGRPAAGGLIETAAANVTAGAVDKRVARKVAEGETRLDETGPAPMLRQKHSKLLTAGQITDVNIEEGAHTITLEIRSSQGKYKFRLPAADKATAEALKQRLQS